MLVTSAHSQSYARTSPVRAAAPQEEKPAGEPTEKYQPSGETPTLAGFNPTAAGAAVMIVTGVACSAGIIATVAALVPGGASIAGGSALAAGLIGGMVSGSVLSSAAERRFKETGEGTAFMTPVMAPDKPFIMVDSQQVQG
ncbi:MAG: hypothetical protein HY319_24610 [Armatimonadetes bacterium]|nr:hypothetical protein [Armatimonadota bacterium]